MLFPFVVIASVWKNTQIVCIMEKFMKIFVKTFVQSNLCALSLILLLSGQQAFSAALTSAAAGIDNFTGVTQWSTGGCISAINPTVITAGVDTFTICATHALTLGVAATNVAEVTVNGTLSLGTIPLALSAGGTLTNNGGTISTGGAAHVFPNIVHIAGSTTLTAATNTSMSGGVTYTQGTLALPTALTTVNGLFSALLASTAYSMPATITSLAGGVAVSGGTLTLGVTNIVTGTVMIGVGGSILGVLKLKDATHTISGATGSIAQLDLSASAPATTAATAITFTPLVGATITVNGFAVPPTASIPLTCVGTVGGTVTPPITLSTPPTGTYTCTGVPTISIISAPIFSTKEKVSVFIEEVM